MDRVSPVDSIVSSNFGGDGEIRFADAKTGLPEDFMALDCGPESIAKTKGMGIVSPVDSSVSSNFGGDGDIKFAGAKTVIPEGFMASDGDHESTAFTDGSGVFEITDWRSASLQCG